MSNKRICTSHCAVCKNGIRGDVKHSNGVISPQFVCKLDITCKDFVDNDIICRDNQNIYVNKTKIKVSKKENGKYKTIPVWNIEQNFIISYKFAIMSFTDIDNVMEILNDVCKESKRLFVGIFKYYNGNKEVYITRFNCDFPEIQKVEFGAFDELPIYLLKFDNITDITDIHQTTIT